MTQIKVFLQPVCVICDICGSHYINSPRRVRRRPTTSIPYFLDGTRRAHPIFAKLMIHLTQDLLPIKVVGDVQYLINRNQTGWVVTLFNNRGNYKPQQGLSAPRRDEVAELRLVRRISVGKESLWLGENQELRKQVEAGKEFFAITIPAGGIRIVEFR